MFTFVSISGPFLFGKDMPTILGLRLMDVANGSACKTDIETKVNMFADDTQLINKTEESIEETFKTLEIYEKASGAKMNLEKTSLDFQTSIQLFILFIFSNQIISKSIAYP
jgi:hypothetical protein